MHLSRIQKIARFFSSEKKFKAMEEESRRWVFTCSFCNEQSSIWESGGIRYKAKGEPSMGVRCPKCGKVGSQKLKKIDK